MAVVVAPLLLPLTPKFSVPGLRAAAAIAEPLRLDDLRSSAGLKPGPTTVAGPQLPNPCAARPGTRPSRRLSEPGFSRAALSLWLSGSVLLALWFALGWIRLALTVRHAGRPAPAWQLEVNELCRRMRISREVRLRIVSGHTSPFVTGLFRPSVLLPAHAVNWDADRRRAVLLHELAHVQRGDCRVQALAHVACAMYWFNPLIWMTSARLCAERERACDDRVLLSGLTASAYAAHLLEIARDLRSPFRPSAALAMARPSELEGRLLAVLASGRARVPAARSRPMAIALVATMTAVVLGAAPAPHVPADAVSIGVPTVPLFVLPADGPSPAERVASRAARVQASRTLEASPDPQAREQAVLDLVASDQNDSLGPLQAALDDPSQDVREKAALGLALRSGPDVIPGLLKALADSDSQVREKAALGLALRRDDRATDALLAASGDSDSQVREKVAMALGTSGDHRAAAALNQLLADSDPQVREKAAAGLTLLQSGVGASANADRIRGGLRGLVGAMTTLAK